MEDKKSIQSVKIPEGVTVEYADGILKVKGKAGEIVRKLNFPKYLITVEDGNVVVKLNAKKFTKRDKMNMGTIVSHIKNMISGVQEAYEYKLKVCSGHFPMNVSINNGQLIIKNFIGEKVPRVLNLKKGADVSINGDMITVKSPDKELAGTIASDIEKMTRRPGFDQRVFQDGIYIVEKAGKKV